MNESRQTAPHRTPEMDRPLRPRQPRNLTVSMLARYDEFPHFSLGGVR